METRPKPAKLCYLTVQDILWINLQVTKQTNRFDYALLEEAVYYQYAYGDSDELAAQGKRFLAGFLKNQPIASGNEVTAFVAFAAFLMLNEHQLNVPDAQAADWMRSGARREDIGPLEHGHSHGDSVRDVVLQILKHFPRTVEALGGRAVPVVVDGAIH